MENAEACAGRAPPASGPRRRACRLCASFETPIVVPFLSSTFPCLPTLPFMDRRKPIHRGSSNVLATLSITKDAVNDQLASGILDAWPAAKADAQAFQSMLTTSHATLETWYTTWRGAEPPEPPDPAYLGVLGTVTAYKNNLKNTASIPRLGRNQYTALSMIAMAYEELYSIAVALVADAPGLKPIAIRGLEDTIVIIKNASKTACTVTVRDLHNQDNSIPMSDADTAIADTQAAWNA